MTSITPAQPAYVNERVGAKFYNVTPAALRKWRREGTGPDFVKFGAAVRYSMDALAAYAAVRTVRSNANKGV